ncbi:hypothetical protein [Denitromonas iodatirespirans]|uniref:Uncharacterized protein n=1 Tax=Denitromonas iodatirespirans TaxID=2795389 RepID=A0A944H9Q5_DENI1|nr:hypothetical protein [Denitromonas iodatirespirans]MBT0959767.1 hypothetical protein [Denitromonas iodatirespirans]
MALEMAFPIVLILTLFIAAFIVLTRHQAHMRAQRNLPDRATYLASAGADGACPKCGATETAEHGLHGGEDAVRIVTCAKCQALLYQYKRDQAAD